MNDLGHMLLSITGLLAIERRLHSLRREWLHMRWAEALPDRIERDIYLRRIRVRGLRLTPSRLRRIEAGIHRARYEAMTATKRT
jgi:predicted DCC family thiol-disulfide oxidoreductase YuxK